MAFTVYLADLIAVTYGRGYEFRIGPSGSLSITGNNRARYYAPSYWTQVEEHDHGTAPDDRHDTTPAPAVRSYGAEFSAEEPAIALVDDGPPAL